MSACWPKAASSPAARRATSPAIRAWARPTWATARRLDSPQEARMAAEHMVAEPILTVTGLTAGYDATDILRGIDFGVDAGEIVAVLGSNGAGKSTLNRVISGVLRARR